MLIEILKHTPSWVFVLFFALLAWGYFQSKDRIVSRSQVSILPVAMIGLSFYGVISAFGIVLTSLASWILGVAVAVGIGVKVAVPRGVTYSEKTQSFSIPGSWLPLVLMMAIFFTKYAVGVILARQLPIVGNPVFMMSIGLCYGFLSGLFLARAIFFWGFAVRSTKAIPNHALHAESR